MSGIFDRFAAHAKAKGDDATTAKRRRVWRIVIGVNAVAVIAMIAGCLLMIRTQGVKADVAQMRDEVGETLTMMSLGGASEAVARHLPKLVNTVARWKRKFGKMKKESFRGMDVEIDHVQAMHRLGLTAEDWRRELEGVSPMQRNELWQKTLKSQIEGEQKKWPNITHEKGASEWLLDFSKEIWLGARHGMEWPVGIYKRVSELVRGGRGIDNLDVGDRIRYILFPYRLSSFTMLRLLGITLAISALGYLMCYLGLKSRFGWLSYAGLIYFFYLINVAIFIVWLEVTE